MPTVVDTNNNNAPRNRRARGVVSSDKEKEKAMPSILNPIDRRNAYKNGFAYHDAVARYRLRPIRTQPTFQNYRLETDGLLPTGTYSGNKGIDRVLYEKRNVPYLMGIELEIEGCEGNLGDEKTKTISHILRKYLPENHVCVPDGSVRGGFEIVTAPLTPTEVSRVGWYGLLRELSRAGLTSHETGRCGLHVSFSRKYLADQTWRRLRGFIVKQRAFFNAISRRDGRNGYCEYTNETTKYTALNLSKNAVAEFRFFRGTLKPSSFIASIETCRCLVEYARRCQETQTTLRLTTSGFLRFLGQPRFTVAREYIGARVDLLTTATATATRRNRTDQERATDARATLIGYCNPYGCNLTTDDNARLLATINNRRFYAENLSLQYSDDISTVEYLIDWQRSRLPRNLQTAVARGWLGHALRVISRTQTNPENARAVLRYIRGGWGNRSTISVEIVRASNQ